MLANRAVCTPLGCEAAKSPLDGREAPIKRPPAPCSSERSERYSFVVRERSERWLSDPYLAAKQPSCLLMGAKRPSRGPLHHGPPSSSLVGVSRRFKRAKRALLFLSTRAKRAVVTASVASGLCVLSNCLTSRVHTMQFNDGSSER